MNLYELHEWTKTLEDADSELTCTQIELNKIFERLGKLNDKLSVDREIIESLLLTARRLFGNPETKDE